MTAFAHASALRHFINFCDRERPDVVSMMPEQFDTARRVTKKSEMVPTELLVDLLEEAAKQPGAEEIAVNYAGCVSLQGFGPANLLWTHCVNVGEIIRYSKKFTHIDNASIATHSSQIGIEVHWHFAVTCSGQQGVAQFSTAVLVHAVRMLRQAFNSNWSPIRIEVQHAKPNQTRDIRQFYRCPVSYNATSYSIIFNSADLDIPLKKCTAESFSFLERRLSRLSEASPMTIQGQVENIIESELACGSVDLENISDILATKPRTLQYKLHEAGTDYNTILKRVRIRRADHYFMQSQKPTLTRLSELLGYGELSSTSRFLKKEMGRNLKADV
jgi:AraC-like DNA-binding protein